MKNFLLTLWQIPQTFLGMLVASCCDKKHEYITDDGTHVIYSNEIDRVVSLGQVVIVPSYHYRVSCAESYKRATMRFAINGYGALSRRFGWFFLLVITLPRFFHNLRHGDTTDFYGDRWARRIAGLE